jgi:oligosaccharide reducing-end xylanase
MRRSHLRFLPSVLCEYAARQNANGPLAHLSNIDNRDVRSEGMSSGMMIAVQMNKKAEFDALWS